MTPLSLVLITAPATEPVTLAEAKLHLRVETADTVQDDLITALIKAARENAETFTRRAFVTQTWDMYLEAFPEVREIRIPKPTLISITSVTYIDTAGASQTLATSEYAIDTSALPGRIQLGYGKSWPSTRTQWNCVSVRFVAGYGTAAVVPEGIKAAIKLLVGHLYEHREAVHTGDGMGEMPLAVSSLLWAFRHVEL